MKKQVLFLAGALCATSFASNAAMAQTANAQTANAQTANAQTANARPATQPNTAPAALNVSPTAVAAEVNNEKIMLIDVERMVNSYRERVQALGTDSPEAQAALQQIRSDLLESLITQRLLYQEAVRLKIAPPAADVDKNVLQFKSSFQKDEDFKAMLAKAGKTDKDVRQRILEEMAVRELTRQWTADVVVPEAEIAKFYKDNPVEFTIPETVQAHHILIGFPQKKSANGALEFVAPAPAEKAKLLSRAKNVLKEAQAKNADMEALALKYSDDPTAKGFASVPGNKGKLDSFRREQVLKSFGDAAFAAPIGKVIGPVETEYGFHVVRVDAKTPSRLLPLTQVRDGIQVVLMQDKVKGRIDQKIKELRDRSTIKKNL